MISSNTFSPKRSDNFIKLNGQVTTEKVTNENLMSNMKDKINIASEKVDTMNVNQRAIASQQSELRTSQSASFVHISRIEDELKEKMTRSQIGILCNELIDSKLKSVPSAEEYNELKNQVENLS